jgi:photosystem II stability/assembly factor-like uncharacterized protein
VDVSEDQLDVLGCSRGIAILRLMQVGWLAGVLVFASFTTMLVSAQGHSPWVMQESGTTAGLRGIDSVDGTVAWASGTDGAVLKTLDGGAHWLKCAVPDASTDGATLDFRGVQAWDAQTAIVMASGPGDKSRLYKTSDGCKTWMLLLKNPDSPEGFFDSFWLNGESGMLLGDPVRGELVVLKTENGGKSWKGDEHDGLALKGHFAAAFAASNGCIAKGNRLFAQGIVTGGKDGARLFSRLNYPDFDKRHGVVEKWKWKEHGWKTVPIPITAGTESAGAFAIAYRYPLTSGICKDCGFGENSILIAVGGDYTKANESAGTAAWSADGGDQWTAAVKPPHGYRSSVQWSEELKAWITVGSNGSDVSHDDGKTWQAIDNEEWNALSLPFVVGPKGRIARLQTGYFHAK